MSPNQQGVNRVVSTTQTIDNIHGQSACLKLKRDIIQKENSHKERHVVTANCYLKGKQ